MRITKYNVEIDDNLHNILVKENSCNYPQEELRNPDEIAIMLNSVYRLNKQAEEHVYLMGFNTKMRLLGVFELSHGIVNASLLGVREIFIRLLLCGASGFVIVHNHPSQNVNPSKEDTDSYNKLKEAGKLMGIQMLDSIIVGGDMYYSFKRNFES